jgi:hypothetical protein
MRTHQPIMRDSSGSQFPEDARAFAVLDKRVFYCHCDRERASFHRSRDRSRHGHDADENLDHIRSSLSSSLRPYLGGGYLSMILFLSGGITVGYLVASLFFLRFWRKVHDRLFLYFAIAFLFLAIERMVFTYLTPANEFTPYVYTIRLVAFALILSAVIDKNTAKQ